MMKRSIRPEMLSAWAVLLAVAGCGSRGREVDRLDRDLLKGAATAADNGAVIAGTVDNRADPALADQIMVDPALVQHANDHSVRPADAATETARAPAAAGARAHRPTLGELARRHAAPRGGTNCYAMLSYSQRWAMRLPAALPLPANATVSEAAGSDAPGCRTRVVSFASAMPAPRLAGFYARHGKAAGYDAAIERRGGEIVVAGDHPADERAYVVTLAPRPDGGTDVDIVSNDGR